MVAATDTLDAPGSISPPRFGEGPGEGLPSVMEGYLAVMEQFLDVQREVMETYLAGSPAP